MKEKYTVALIGNPNVGKSTLFNQLTGLKQHTGNWAGKTVEIARGYCRLSELPIELVDLPGTYSLISKSPEEEVTRDYLESETADAVIIVCDALCLERNLHLALQTLELTDRALLCVNLMDEAKKEGLQIDLPGIERELGIPIVGTVARNKRSIKEVVAALEKLLDGKETSPRKVRYPANIEESCRRIQSVIPQDIKHAAWWAHRLLEGEKKAIEKFSQYPEPVTIADNERLLLEKNSKKISDYMIAASLLAAEEICAEHIQQRSGERKIGLLDQILTNRITAFPLMFCMLLVLLFLTVKAANYPSAWLSDLFAFGKSNLSRFFHAVKMPSLLHSFLLDGIYTVTAFVVSVMLPPMAIFFPLFTLLEDAGVLPRIAFNLDKVFFKCKACGKQSLTMCMGIGCNAVGVTGARIIDSKRERLMAILTNAFVPCNGKFPTLILICTLFFAVGSSANFITPLLLGGLMILAVLATLLATKMLSMTFLKGCTTSFILELPPYRRPQFVKTLTRSLLDRTLSVLARAILVSIPAGMVIWFLTHITVNGVTLLSLIATFLDPMGKLLGLDGTILFAFILGLPANEIVLPIVFMAYTSGNAVVDISNLDRVKDILLANGWDLQRAVCVTAFMLFHWPCATTLLTVYKETKSIKWTLVSALLPALFGILFCILLNLLFCVW